MRYTISFALASLIAAPTLAEVPAVVTDIAPVHSLVAMVMGDLGSPVLLLDRGANPHDFQLRPSQAQAVAGAGLVVWIGPAMSPWLDRALDGTGTRGAQLALLTANGTETRAFAENEHHGGKGHDHAAEAEGDDDAAEAGDHGPAHDGTDPHAWLDPHNAGTWVGLIASELSRLDPANAVAYAANADAAKARIETLDRKIAARLAPVKDRPFVVFHDAFGYFTAHYGLSPAGAIAPGDAASPGAARLRDLTETARGSVCIFTEVNHDADLSIQMAEGAGARLGEPLDPEGVMLEPGPGLYPALLTGLADALADCLAQD
ncbi:MAG: zinc ABC transporter substrate-binding protein [Gemmobacter sp.]